MQGARTSVDMVLAHFSPHSRRSTRGVKVFALSYVSTGRNKQRDSCTTDAPQNKNIMRNTTRAFTRRHACSQETHNCCEPGRQFKFELKPASNDVGCICEQIGKEQCRMKAFIAIDMNEWHCSKICIKWLITTKNFLYLRYASWVSSYHWLHVSKGRTILLQWCELTQSTSDGSTSSGHGSTILSASNTVKKIWYKTAFYLKLITDTCTQHRWFPKKWKVKIVCFSWHLCAFCGTTWGQFVVI